MAGLDVRWMTEEEYRTMLINVLMGSGMMLPPIPLPYDGGIIKTESQVKTEYQVDGIQPVYLSNCKKEGN